MQQSSLPIVALIGRPNVGKSSLFNRLARSNKAIIDPTPGVTRDRQYARVEWGGHHFLLVDTGGVELDSEDAMTALIRQQSLAAMEEADILLFLVDGKAGPVGEDMEIAQLLRRSDKPVYCLVNKVDGPELESQLTPVFFELGLEELHAVSAAHGYGINTFLEYFVTRHLPVNAAEELPENTISIACIGRPNVGKSSLINRLVGEERMVVSDLPGTTRDSVQSLLSKGNRHYLLIDTAGIRRKGKVREKVEKFSVMRALSAMEECDLTLLLIDAREGVTEQDTKVIGYALERGRACLILVNKWDLLKDKPKRQKWVMDDVAMATRFVEYAPILKISALTGSGVNKIFPIIGKIYRQYCRNFTTNQLNRVLQKAVEGHPPALYKGKRLKFYYTTQVSTKPPTMVLFVNYPKGIHFSYHRYLVNQFRQHLGLDQSPVRLLFRERKRKKYG